MTNKNDELLRLAEADLDELAARLAQARRTYEQAAADYWRQFEAVGRMKSDLKTKRSD